MTDLHALVSDRCAAKIAEGKRPSKADLEWLEATREPVSNPSSVEKSRSTTKGETGITVKTYHADPFEAERINDEIFARQRAKFPMQDGTVGAPMVPDADGKS
jgi:hypothetical protein